jgi:hypothetical protein
LTQQLHELRRTAKWLFVAHEQSCAISTSRCESKVAVRAITFYLQHGGTETCYHKMAFPEFPKDPNSQHELAVRRLSWSGRETAKRLLKFRFYRWLNRLIYSILQYSIQICDKNSLSNQTIVTLLLLMLSILQYDMKVVLFPCNSKWNKCKTLEKGA